MDLDENGCTWASLSICQEEAVLGTDVVDVVDSGVSHTGLQSLMERVVTRGVKGGRTAS